MAKYEFWGDGGTGCDKIEEIFETSQPVGTCMFEKELKIFLQNLYIGGEIIHDIKIDHLMWLNYDSEYLNLSFGILYKDYDWGMFYRIKAV